jgi:hypothetical protein
VPKFYTHLMSTTLSFHFLGSNFVKRNAHTNTKYFVGDSSLWIVTYLATPSPLSSKIANRFYSFHEKINFFYLLNYCKFVTLKNNKNILETGPRFGNHFSSHFFLFHPTYNPNIQSYFFSLSLYLLK